MHDGVLAEQMRDLAEAREQEAELEHEVASHAAELAPPRVAIAPATPGTALEAVYATGAVEPRVEPAPSTWA